MQDKLKENPKDPEKCDSKGHFVTEGVSGL